MHLSVSHFRLSIKESSLEIVLQPPAVGGGAPLDALPAGLVLEDRPGAPRHPHVVPGPGAREGGARDHGAVLQPHREALVSAGLICEMGAMSSSQKMSQISTNYCRM